MGVLDEVLAANEAYAASFGKKADLALPPSRAFAILTCMDARLDPAKYAGLSEGDAHVIRNAGGRASDDAIRSLVISHKLLGTNEWFVIHHSNCGMEFFTNDVMADLCGRSLDTAELTGEGFVDVGPGPGSVEAKFIDWLTFKDNAQSVVDDVARIRIHPLVPSDVAIYGFIYEVETGRLVEVPAATRVGRPRSALRPGRGVRGVIMAPPGECREATAGTVAAARRGGQTPNVTSPASCSPSGR